MKNKQVAKNPLLYIQQPTITTPKVQMQHNYYTPKHPKKLPNQPNKKSAYRAPLKRTHSSKYWVEQNSEETVDEVVDHEEVPEESKFKDMTIIQKVNYFINRPDYAPIMRCEIKTKEKKVQGVITGLKEEQVLIRIGRRSSSSEIPLTDITAIRLIGF